MHEKNSNAFDDKTNMLILIKKQKGFTATGPKFSFSSPFYQST